MRTSLLPLCVALALCACETNPGYSFVSYRIAQPTASTRHYVTEPGFLGFTIDAMGPEHRGMWYGYSIGWTQLEERTQDPFTFPAGAAQGLQIRRLDVLPVLGAVQWDLSRHWRTAGVQPFVGMLAGVVYAGQHTSLGLFSVSKTGWRPAIAPQVGVYRRLGEFRGMVDLRYLQPFGGGPRCSYLGLGLGFAYVID
jgi:hypothetical protein